MRSTSVKFLQIIIPTVVVLFVLHHADCIEIREHQRTARLTTFGVAQNTPEPPSRHPPQAQGKECKNDANCTTLADTTCKKARDGKLRCLCGDKTAPNHGSCHHSKLGLHARCNEDKDCIEDAVCKMPNSTNSNIANRKTCLCKEGFEEEDHECNGAVLTAVPRFEACFLLLLYPAIRSVWH